jgi:hypothetical protein
MHDQSLGRFCHNVKTVCDAVLQCISRGFDPSEPITRHVGRVIKRTSRVDRMIDEVLAFSSLMLTFRDGAALKANRHVFSSLDFNRRADNAGGKVDYDILLLEYLATAWLVLYFLSVPFPQTWERVRRWEEDGGGQLPSGVCISKATGDLFRQERMRNAHGPVVRDSDLTGDLSVLTHCPAALFSDFFEASSCRASTFQSFAPDESHILARCYEFIQLRLYSHSGLSIRYFVPASTVAHRIAVCKTGDAWTAMIGWLRRSVFESPVDGQSVQLINATVRFDCVINAVTGIYTYEELRPGEGEPTIVFPGTYFREPRRLMYRSWLRGIKLEDGENLISCNDEQLNAIRSRMVGTVT